MRDRSRFRILTNADGHQFFAAIVDGDLFRVRGYCPSTRLQGNDETITRTTCPLCGRSVAVSRAYRRVWAHYPPEGASPHAK